MIVKQLAAVAVVAACAGFGGYYVNRVTVPAAPPAALPLTYSGTLSVAGVPANDEHRVVVSVFESATSTTSLCSSGDTRVTPVAGVFTVTMPDSCRAALANAPNHIAFVGLKVDDTDMMDRQQVGAAPYALSSTTPTVPVIIGLSSTKVGGDGIDPNNPANPGGYQGLATLCAREVGATTAPCTVGEAASSMAKGIFGGARMGDIGWTIGDASTGDCVGFTTTGGFGAAVSFSTPKSGFPLTSPCDPQIDRSNANFVLCCGAAP